MKTILFLNNTIKECGVQQWGIRLGKILTKSLKFHVVYEEISSGFQYFQLIDKYKPSLILYNYHVDLMPWLDRSNKYPGLNHIAIVHEGFSHLSDRIGFNYYIYVPQNTVITPGWEKRIFKVGRPLLEYTGDYPVNSIPTVGSFGFGFKHKQFPLIVRKVNEEFEEALVRLNIPFQFKADPSGILAKEEERLCFDEITKPGVNLEVTNDFLSEKDLLTFLAGNDINAFFYDTTKLDSSSGATDFALSVDRPIAITNSPMFTHIISKIGLSACIEEHSFSEIIKQGTSILSPLKDNWINDKLLEEFEEIFNHV